MSECLRKKVHRGVIERDVRFNSHCPLVPCPADIVIILLQCYTKQTTNHNQKKVGARRETSSQIFIFGKDIHLYMLYSRFSTCNEYFMPNRNVFWHLSHVVPIYIKMKYNKYII